jgi:uncharacterized protein
MDLGVGIGLRRELYDALWKTNRRLDWLELIPENFIVHGGWRRQVLEKAAERWPLIAHGVALNVGGPDPLDAAYLRSLKTLLDWLDPPFFSDHLCYQHIGGVYFHDLLPLPFTEEAVRWVAGRAREVSDRLERPLVLENITYYAEMPGGTLTEGEFVSAVLEEADAGLLLDVNNAYLNGRNHGRDPWQVLRALPLERTTQIHLAGHVQDRECDVLLDDHGSAVTDEVWALYTKVTQRIGAVPTLIEWDNNIPPLDRVLEEADRARAIQKEYAPVVADTPSSRNPNPSSLETASMSRSVPTERSESSNGLTSSKGPQ